MSRSRSFKSFWRKIKFCIGTGKTIFHIGPLEVKKKYFMEGWCQYEDLTYNKTWAHVAIYAAGSLFNIIVILILNALIYADILPVDLFSINLLTSRFILFSSP